MPGLKNGSAPIIANTTQPSNSSTQNLTSTTASPKVINASSTTTNPSIHNTTKSATSKPMTTTPMNGTVTTTASRATSPSTAIPVTATPKSASAQGKSSGFDVGSFVGGIMLTLGLLAVAYIGCKTYHSRRGIRYRTM
uniref:Porimin n=1 Tax=Sphenodon punctatus TaxID=8508 RepID=A0A8D0LAU8_SPHPU